MVETRTVSENCRVNRPASRSKLVNCTRVGGVLSRVNISTGLAFVSLMGIISFPAVSVNAVS